MSGGRARTPPLSIFCSPSSSMERLITAAAGAAAAFLAAAFALSPATTAAALVLTLVALLAFLALACEVAAVAEGVSKTAWGSVGGGGRAGGGSSHPPASSTPWLTASASGPDWEAGRMSPSSLAAVLRFVHPATWPASDEEEAAGEGDGGGRGGPAAGAHRGRLLASGWRGRPATRGARRPSTGPRDSPPSRPPRPLGHGGNAAAASPLETVKAWLGRALPCEACASDVAASLAIWRERQHQDDGGGRSG